MRKIYWERLSEKPEVIKILKGLPEGSQLNFVGGPRRLLRIEEKHLILLGEAGLGNIVAQPVEEYYALDNVSYNIEKDTKKGLLALDDLRPIKIVDPWQDREKVERYLKILKSRGVA